MKPLSQESNPLTKHCLMGHIPSSLGNLAKLESLDLSLNKLTGKISGQLMTLNILSVLNLLQNHMMGPIPQGQQFITFKYASYIGKLWLCGFLLLRKYKCDGATQPPPSIFQDEEDLEYANGFDWKVAVNGVWNGMVFGFRVYRFFVLS